MTKEQIYDTQIFPLMSQVIEICKKHKIANLCTFSLDRSNKLCCTTALLEDEYEPPDEFIEALEIIRPPISSPGMQVTIRDKDGNLKEILRFVD